MSNQDKPVVGRFWCRLYPELRHFESREELRALRNDFRQQAFARRRAWRLGVMMAAVASAAGVVVVFGLLSFGLPVWIASTINAALWAGLGVWAGLFLWQRPYIRFVRQHLQDHGIAICLECGYDLRGQTEPRCPECGRAFDPKLLSGVE